METVEVSVVIPARDAESAVRVLLGSLDSQTLPRERFEVIVVDNASRDDTAAVARGMGATVVTDPMPSRAGARNTGAGAARGDAIAFIDSDCVADPNWLAALLECGARGDLLAGRVVTTTRPGPNAVERFEARTRFGQEQWVAEGWAATANLLVPRALFEELGGFDASFRIAGEDADLCYRATAAGYRLAYCADAIVTHYAESELVPMLRRAFRLGHGAEQFNHRYGAGDRAWRRPGLLRGDGTLAFTGIDAGSLSPGEQRRMRALARAGYAARMMGSLWATLERAR